MAKTGKQIQSDFYRLLRSSPIASSITGSVYRNGYRPRDSRKEDAIVSFTTGLGEQFQSGIVTINIYVPDIDPNKDGIMMENGQRSEELEVLAKEWVKHLCESQTEYDITLHQTIYTDEAPEISQHFVVVKLRYQSLDED